jgi:hypothetical protein
VKLRTAIRRKRSPMTPRLVLVPEAGEKRSLTASAPPPRQLVAVDDALGRVLAPECEPQALRSIASGIVAVSALGGQGDRAVEPATF